MPEIKPSSPPGEPKQSTPTPPPTLPAPIEILPEASDEAEQIEQLLTLNEQLQTELAAVRSELSAALSAATTPLLRVGEGTRRVTLNARSLASMYMSEEHDSTNHDRPTGRWKVMADTHSLTDYSPEAQALDALASFVAQWEAALQPPSRS